jgi:formylmethanofuran dehydrogenase subunit E
MDMGNCTRCGEEVILDDLVRMLDWLVCDICYGDL